MFLLKSIDGNSRYQCLPLVIKSGEERKREEAEQKKKEAQRIQKAKEEMAKSRQSLEDIADTLMREEEVVKANFKAADELMSDATSKLHDALSATAVNKQTVNVATMMLDTAKTKRDQGMQSLKKIGQKRKLLTDKQHKLLEKAMSTAANADKQKKSKAKVTQSAKRAKTI